MVDTGFDNIRLPDEIEQGSTGGPQFYTSVLRLSSGAEARNQNWQDAKCVFDISYGVTSDTFYDVITFFRARRGRLRGFRFKDWTDFIGVGEPCDGLVDGTNTLFQLQKTYNDGIVSYIRKITRPVYNNSGSGETADTVVIYKNNIPLAQTTDWNTQDAGIVKLHVAPVVGDVITADFEFDVPVRFDTDTLALNVQNFNAASVGSMNLTELIE